MRVMCKGIVREECNYSVESVFSFLGWKRKVVEVKDSIRRPGRGTYPSPKPWVMQPTIILVFDRAFDQLVGGPEVLHKRLGDLALKMDHLSYQVEASQAKPEDGAEDRTICRMNGRFFLCVVRKRALVLPVFGHWVWLELFSKLALIAIKSHRRHR